MDTISDERIRYLQRNADGMCLERLSVDDFDALCRRALEAGELERKPAGNIKAEKAKLEAALAQAKIQADREIGHIEADDALCEFLVAIGHADVVAEYEKIKKWWA